MEKTLMLGKIEGRRRRGRQRMRCWMASLTQWTWIWVNSGSWWWTGKPGCCRPWSCKQSDMIEWLNWTEAYLCVFLFRKLCLYLIPKSKEEDIFPQLKSLWNISLPLLLSSRSVLINKVATIHMWLLKIWDAATWTETMNFIPYLIAINFNF